MDLPSSPQNHQQERIGVSSVALALAKLNQIWRETPLADVGIDGQIEYVDHEGKATGQMLAAQVKSGSSYLNDHGDHWRFYPAQKHRLYWERYPVPVLLLLHDPDLGKTYWCDARQWLRGERTHEKFIAVPKNQRLDNTTPEALFETAGVNSGEYLTVPEVLRRMIEMRSTEAAFPVSYFELFVHGLTNICRGLYFHMDLVNDIADYNLAVAKAEFGMGLGHDEYEFLFSYIRFLVSQHIADIDFSDCLIDWYDREMTPTFVAPLTSRGRELVRLIGSIEQEMRAERKIASAHDHGHVAQESFIGRVLSEGTVMRFPIIADFVANFDA